MRLADDLEAATGRTVRDPLYAMLGYDPAAGRAHAGGALIATPMARLRDLTAGVLGALGAHARRGRGGAGRRRGTLPIPVALAHPLTDLVDLLGAIHASGRRAAIVTSDDRAPTERTLEALGLGALVDAVVCADDDVPTKPAPDAVLHCCALLGTRAGAHGRGRRFAGRHRSWRGGPERVSSIGVRTGIGDDADLADADVLLDSVASLRAAIAD